MHVGIHNKQEYATCQFAPYFGYVSVATSLSKLLIFFLFDFLYTRYITLDHFCLEIILHWI